MQICRGYYRRDKCRLPSVNAPSIEHALALVAESVIRGCDISQDEVQTIFKTVSDSLARQPWFKNGKWKVSTHTFPPKKPTVVTFHVFKDHWFNHEREGIHIESFLAFDPRARRKSSVTLHLLHYDLIPGTKIKRRDIAQPVVDAIFDQVSSWDGYTFRAGKYGLQPFTKALDGSANDFPSMLTDEVTRLCKAVGPIVDSVLNKVLTGTLNDR